MENSKIGWTHHTQNFWQGCHKVSEACKHCYIGSVMKRAGREPFEGPIRTTTTWKAPYRWNQEAKDQGARLRIFTCSLSDFFHPEADRWREDAWQVIRECDNLDWLILTKRSELIADRLPEDWGEGFPNVYLGVTIENQENIKRVRDLIEIPAVTHFVSAEPLLGRIDLRPYLAEIDWVITGCEKAHKNKRRIMDMDWVRDLKVQCQDNEKAFFFKQYYKGTKITHDGRIDNKVCQQWPLPRKPLKPHIRNVGRYNS